MRDRAAPGTSPSPRSPLPQGEGTSAATDDLTNVLSLLMPCIDLHHLLVRLLDRPLGLPAVHQDPVDHPAQDVGASHLADGGMHSAGGGEMPPPLQHHAPMREHWSLPEVGRVHALVRWPPASIPFLDHHPQVLWRHPVHREPFGHLGIGVVLEEDPFCRVSSHCARRPRRTGSSPVAWYSSLSDSARWA